MKCAKCEKEVNEEYGTFELESDIRFCMDCYKVIQKELMDAMQKASASIVTKYLPPVPQ